MDFFEKNFLKSVNKGDTLARIIPEIKPVDGYDVFGNIVEPKYDNKPIFIAGNKTGYFPRLNPVVGVDFLILNGMPPARLKQIKNSLDFKHVVIPASYSKYQSKKAKEILKSLNVSCYDIACNGAFVFQNGKR
jgi:hypothetical protein